VNTGKAFVDPAEREKRLRRSVRHKLPAFKSSGGTDFQPAPQVMLEPCGIYKVNANWKTDGGAEVFDNIDNAVNRP
jgi:hypothetical protein